MKTIAILWNSMEDNFENVLNDLKNYSNILDCFKINFNDNFDKFISDIYPYSGSDKWKLEYKINIMNNKYKKNEILVLFLDIPNSEKIYCERKKTYLYKNVEEIKQNIRQKYKNLVKNYCFDNIFHMTDDEIEFNKTLLIIKKHLIINCFNNKDGFVTLSDFLINEKKFIKKDELNGKRDKFWFANNMFMFKKAKENSYEVYSELLMSEIANILEIDSTYYIPTIYNGLMGVTTLNFIDDDETFVDGSHLIDFYITGKNNVNLINNMKELCKFNNIENLPNVIEKYCLMNNLYFNPDIGLSLKKMFAFDTITLQTDRNPNNWGILINKKNKTIKLSPIYDNSNSMGMSKPTREILNYSLHDIYNLPTVMLLDSNDSFFDYKLNIINRVDDPILINIFNKYINRLKDIDIYYLLSNIEKSNNIIFPKEFKEKVLKLLYENLESLNFIIKQKLKINRK